MADYINLFDTDFPYYRKIVTAIAILGYKEEDIKKREEENENLDIDCLLVFPESEKSTYNSIVFSMMFPQKNHNVPSPQFFSLTLTNEKGVHSYLYNLKFSETYVTPKEKKVQVPLVFSIKSNKEDFEPFKEILYLIHLIMVKKVPECDNKNITNNFRKTELLNIMVRCFSLFKPPPHSTIKLNVPDQFFSESNKDNLDFYYSSNCEIPCNKNDSDIDMLFSLLDQAIIIKLIFAIIHEKQIVLRSKEAYRLSLAFRAIIKLIFPFKWNHPFLPVLAEVQLGFLETPGPFMFGVLSSSMELNSLIKDYVGLFIVDCDINEVYNLELYTPPINRSYIKSGLVQGENSVVVNKSTIKLRKENSPELVSIKPEQLNEGNLVIDLKNNNLFIDQEFLFLSEEERVELRTKIQILKNPELFQIQDMISKNPSQDKYKDMERGSFLEKRSFSYNIQKTFCKMFEKKMGNKESAFMKFFHKSNLYKIYQHPFKYQNDSGKIIINNMEKTKDNPRYYENSFEVIINFNKFPANSISDLLREEKENKALSDILLPVFEDYIKVKGYTMHLGNKFYAPPTPQSIKTPRNIRNYNTPKYSSSKNLLQLSVGELQLFLTKKNQDEGEFLFYTKNGFIEFVKNVKEFLTSKHLNLINEVVYKKFSNEIAFLLKTSPELNDLKEEINVLESYEDMSISHQDSKVTGESDLEKKSIRVTIEIIDDEDDEDYGSSMDFENPLKTLTIIKFNNNDQEKTPSKHKLQFLLFLAIYLEEIKSNEELTKIFLQNFKKEIPLNKLILNLYLKAFDYGLNDGNLEEFPYYNFYIFLCNLKIEEMNELSISQKYIELIEIFKYEYTKKEKIINKKNRMPPKRRKISADDTISIPTIEVIREPLLPTSKYITQRSTINSILSISVDNLSILKSKYIINSNNNFPIPSECKVMTTKQVKSLYEKMMSILPSEEDTQKLTTIEILDCLANKIEKANELNQLIGALRVLDIAKYKTLKEKISFWVNCSNFLFLYAVGYKRLYLKAEIDWKNFMKNIYYQIGKYQLSFADIQYILFKECFFLSEYRPRKEIKNLLLVKNKEVEASYFLLSFPTKDFLGISIIQADDLECEIVSKQSKYFSSYMKIINEKEVSIPESWLKLYPNFRSRKDFLNHMETELSDKIQKWGTSIRKVPRSWEMNFENLRKKIIHS